MLFSFSYPYLDLYLPQLSPFLLFLISQVFTKNIFLICSTFELGFMAMVSSLNEGVACKSAFWPAARPEPGKKRHLIRCLVWGWVHSHPLTSLQMHFSYNIVYPCFKHGVLKINQVLIVLESLKQAMSASNSVSLLCL